MTLDPTLSKWFRSHSHLYALVKDIDSRILQVPGIKHQGADTEDEDFKIKFHSINKYRKICNIRRTKSQNLNDSRLVLQLSLPNLLKPGVK